MCYAGEAKARLQLPMYENMLYHSTRYMETEAIKVIACNWEAYLIIGISYLYKHHGVLLPEMLQVSNDFPIPLLSRHFFIHVPQFY